MGTTNSPTELKFDSCDAEPIHLIASIQDAGFLIGFSPDSLKVEMVSENLSQFLGLSYQQAVGKPLGEILPHAWVTKQALFLKKANGEKSGHLESIRLADGVTLDCYFYFSDGLGILELEPSQGQVFSTDLPERINETLNEIRRAQDMASAGKALAKGIRELTNLDRVMIYRFLPKTWHGEVLAESRIASAHSFDGLRFPATDIPKPARELYLRNRVRFIHDARRDVSRLYPSKNPLNGKFFNLQDSRLRAVSKFHLEYLKNMGVISSFSVAIIVDEQLWGLVACHHLSPLAISHQIRSCCELLSQAFALRVQSEEKLIENEKRLVFEAKLRKLLTAFKDEHQPLRNFLSQHADLCEIFGANGIAVTREGKVDLVGLTPTISEILEIAKFVQEHLDSQAQRVFHTTSLSQMNKRWDYLVAGASGLLAVPISKVPGEFLMIFRPEIVQNLFWGGDPTKTLEKRQYPGPINPRKSFETWRETISGHSADWEDYQIEGAIFIQDMVFETFIPREQIIAELNQKVLSGK